MTKKNVISHESVHRQYLMQELQINTFSELSKIFTEKFAKLFRRSSK